MNLEKAGLALKDQNIDYLYVSGFDENISEYVPKHDSLRFALTRFSGSVAEALLHKEGVITLFVDGRYHEQADIECPSEDIHIVKVAYGTTLQSALLEWLKSHKVKSLGHVSLRTPESLRVELSKICETVAIDHERFFKKINFVPKEFNGEIVVVNEDFEPVHEKCSRLITEEDAYFISGLDTLAWLTNTRSYGIPFQATFRGFGLATGLGVHIFTDCKLAKGHKLPVEVSLHSKDEWSEVCKKLSHLQNIYWDQTFTSAYFREKLKLSFPDANIKMFDRPFAYEWQALKTPSEIKTFKKSFEHSDKAIFNSFQWLKTQVESNAKISEFAFKEMVSNFYKDEGANGHSFSSISGFGANSSIIHYSNASTGVFYKPGENVLLDSGAFYESGLATDCTRTMCFGKAPSLQQKKAYTLVLKSLLALLNLSFKKGTLGKEIDAIARKPIIEAGYDYAHGTGHGVGVNVHEYGYSITPMSDMEIREGTVGSLEPGLYIENQGGVRLENVVTVIEDPDNSDHLCFDNMVYIGFCHELIDQSMLADYEVRQLDAYEEQCKDLGRSFL